MRVSVMCVWVILVAELWRSGGERCYPLFYTLKLPFLFRVFFAPGLEILSNPCSGRQVARTGEFKVSGIKFLG